MGIRIHRRFIVGNGMTAPNATTVIAIALDAMKHRGPRRPAIDAETRFDDIALDELERQEIALGVEDACGFEIRDAEMERWESIADIVALITARPARA